ncbi:hypothetical protein LB505_007087 [Fusarium chuoi]|nr:hypothetical protein LB505_007087 [Fusarium chuoi]
MLTPDQATQKLRRLEQSFSVSRGQGVTRYDLVQLPSNDPIEDDHAEKIVQVPSRSSVETDNSDWMFWGVFDGHSCLRAVPRPSQPRFYSPLFQDRAPCYHSTTAAATSYELHALVTLAQSLVAEQGTESGQPLLCQKIRRVATLKRSSACARSILGRITSSEMAVFLVD